MDNSDLGRSVPDGLSSATPIEPVPVSPLRASIPSADDYERLGLPTHHPAPNAAPPMVCNSVEIVGSLLKPPVKSVKRKARTKTEQRAYEHGYRCGYSAGRRVVRPKQPFTECWGCVEPSVCPYPGDCLNGFRDSDGSPKGGDACGSVHDSAGRETASPTPSTEPRLSTKE